MSAPSEHSAQLVTEMVVPDLAKTVAFLVEMGFVTERVTGGFAVLRWDDALLFVAENAVAAVPARWCNVRVMVPDADAMLEQAQSLGGRILTAIGDRSYGLRDFVVLIPGGVEIRFAQRLPGF